MEYPFSKKYSWCISGRKFGSFRCHSSGGYENPLADPGIVGVSSGAGLAGVIMLIFMPEAISVAYSSGFYRCYVVRMCCIFIGVEKWNQADTYYIGRCSGQCILGSGISALLVSTLIKCRELFCGWLADSRQEAGLK